MRLIVDADSIVYKAACSARIQHYRFNLIDGDCIDYGKVTKTTLDKLVKLQGWEQEGFVDGYWHDLGEVVAVSAMRQTIHSIVSKFPKHETIFYLTGTKHDNYRYKLAKIKPYKSDRLTKPKYYDEIRQMFIDEYKANVVDNIEADDAVGILLYQEYETVRRLCGEMNLPSYCHSICASIDKDLNNVPGWHYNYDTQELYFVHEHDTWKSFYGQILTGDDCDTVPGLKIFMEKTWKKGTKQRPWKLGPETRDALTEGITTDREGMQMLYDVYSECNYDDPNMTKFYHRVKEIGQLLWIQREEGVLWVPPNI